ncbi:MAG: magnesium and cobalt transport protein CorA [Actinomycetota bacterium]
MNKRRPIVRAIAPRVRRAPSSGAPQEPKPPTSNGQARAGGSVVDSAVYADGERIASKATLAETYQCLRDNPGSTAWIGLFQPTPSELASLADEFGLHELAVEDAIVAHQRPKLERYGQTLFVVLRAAIYLDAPEEVEFGEVHLFVGPDFVVTVRHSDAPDLAAVRRRMESEPDLLRRGPEAILYAILDKLVDGYIPVIAGLENDIDEIEIEIFRGDPQVSRRIYQLSREVIEFQRASQPLVAMLQALGGGFDKYGIDDELQRYLRDVADHVTHVVERVDSFRQLLRDMLAVNATLVAQAQNEEMKSLTLASNAQNEEIKKISAWAAILFAPTLIGTIYGMNFDNIAELRWALGYPFALGLMVMTCTVLFLVFKRRNWL